MTANEYQKEALRTEGGYPGVHRVIKSFPNKGTGFITRLANGLMGLNGEAGEAIDILKKYMFQDHELNREHLAKELGDAAWYLALSADALGYSLEEILQMNVEKLRARYPDGFDAEHSNNRKEGDI